VQAPDLSQNLNRYSYCINNPLKYTDPTGEVFGVDDAIIILAMAYFGGMQANFFTADNPMNPADWNWSSPSTYIGIGSGALSGAGMAGLNVPTLFPNLDGMITRGVYQAGVNVGLNGIGNAINGDPFFDNWGGAALSGFVNGAATGYQLADANETNYWWGNEVKYGRKQWSFFTSEKPYKTIQWDVKNVGSKKLNDCVATTFVEGNSYFGGETPYEEFITITNYQDNVGTVTNRTGYEKMLSSQFIFSKFDPVALANPQMAQDILDRGYLLSTNMPLGIIRHGDNLRSISYYYSGKVVMGFRIGSYKLSTVNDKWWFYLLRGLKLQ
jgi:hypothetical protein